MKLNYVWNCILIAIASLTLSSCGKSNAEKTLDDGSRAFQVVAAQVTEDTASKDNYYIGTVEASVTTPVSFSSMGTVEKVLVSPGQFVGKGQVLATLNSATYKSSLDMAESMEKQAKDAYDRLSKVYKEGSLPEIKFIEIESKLQQAVSSAQIARKAYNDCILRAPVSAMVGVRNAEPGTSANPINPAFTLYKIDNVYIKVAVPENEISKMKKGATAKVQIGALGGKEFSGRIEEIGVIANTITHTYDIKLLVKNNNNEIKPGMVSNVYMANSGTSSSIVVPNDAVLSYAGKNYVFVLNADGKTVKKQEVAVGKYIGNNLAIRDGLTLSDKIIVAGQHKLYHNAQVSVKH